MNTWKNAFARKVKMTNDCSTAEYKKYSSIRGLKHYNIDLFSYILIMYLNII